jgi:glycosyltransferase involved in cell wall biosynthesis
VFLINNPTPEEQPLVRAMGVRSTIRVFDWSDDFTRVPTDLAAQEAMEAAVDEILQGADLVLAINETLAARARARGIRAAVVPNGTNMEPEPGPPRGRAARKLRARLTPPVLGYAGFVNERRIDLEIIEHLARSLPKCSLLFLGPVFRDFHLRFPRLPNIHFHPAVPYRVLQDHIRVFDVCLVPHLVNAHTAGNDPIKFADYLSTGRPIVTTPVAGSERWPGLVRVAGSPEAFFAEVEAALGDCDRVGEAARLEAARQNSWSGRVRTVEEAIAACFGGAPARASGAVPRQTAPSPVSPATRSSRGEGPERSHPDPR